MEHKYTHHDNQMALQVMQWYGWGSPIGLSIALLSVGVFIWLLHQAGLV